MLPTKFMFSWPSGFRGVCFLKIDQPETRIACGHIRLKENIVYYFHHILSPHGLNKSSIYCLNCINMSLFQHCNVLTEQYKFVLIMTEFQINLLEWNIYKTPATSK
jgi:hypothetical protein